jgi:hypothetical protein
MENGPRFDPRIFAAALRAYAKEDQPTMPIKAAILNHAAALLDTMPRTEDQEAKREPPSDPVSRRDRSRRDAVTAAGNPDLSPDHS